MWAERAKELLAITLVGEGVLTALAPRRRALLWMIGPRLFKKLDALMAARPGLFRLLGAVEAGVGLWLAFRAYRGSRN